MNELSRTSDLDALVQDVDDRRLVLLGEASHGTHEYYTWRSALSRRLITEKGFRFIAVEGDWPECYRINRYVKGYPDAGHSIVELLREFDRWPTWMWANWEVAALVEWLREYNQSMAPEEKIGFYGLDVYSLWDSIRAIFQYLEEHDPSAAVAVKKAMDCFDRFEDNEQMYARYSLTEHSCRDTVLQMLKEVRSRVPLMNGDREVGFSAEQNALIAVNAEKYYRSMMRFDNESWNIRDRHMMETLERLMIFFGPEAKGIVWEHNTHIGDARATDMYASGMVSLGQLAREHYGKDKVYLVGFGSYKGSVIAGSEWGAPMKEMKVPAARKGSIEFRLHHESPQNRYFLFGNGDATRFGSECLHRAIGVVYRPEREEFGNYVTSRMAERYDAFVYLDETSALHPLHMEPHNTKVPETYPFGF